MILNATASLLEKTIMTISLSGKFDWTKSPRHFPLNKR